VGSGGTGEILNKDGIPEINATDMPTLVTGYNFRAFAKAFIDSNKLDGASDEEVRRVTAEHIQKGTRPIIKMIGEYVTASVDGIIVGDELITIPDTQLRTSQITAAVSLLSRPEDIRDISANMSESFVLSAAADGHKLVGLDGREEQWVIKRAYEKSVLEPHLHPLVFSGLFSADLAERARRQLAVEGYKPYVDIQESDPRIEEEIQKLLRRDDDDKKGKRPMFASGAARSLWDLIGSDGEIKSSRNVGYIAGSDVPETVLVDTTGRNQQQVAEGVKKFIIVAASIKGLF
jgi:hypothetical protein